MNGKYIYQSDWRGLADAGGWDEIPVHDLSQEVAQIILKEIREIVPLVSEKDGMMEVQAVSEWSWI